MNGIVDQLEHHLGLGRALSVLIVIVGLFLVAWLVSRIATNIATYFVTRSERRRAAREEVTDTGVISGIRQRETAIALIQTSIRYLAFALAFVFSLATIAGAQRLQTVLGASFLAIIIAFAAQRFLTDVIAGLLMFFEGWFRIGDTVAIDPLQVNGVVEAVSLRSLTIRSITGEMIHVPNSQVSMLRVIPRGYRDVEVEIFTTDLEAGEALDRPGRVDRAVRRDAGSCSGRRSSRPRRSTSACTGSPPTARSPWDASGSPRTSCRR